MQPRIVDPEGFGARIVPTYQYVGPSKFNEIFESQSYIDCVGHPPNMPVAREVEQASGVSDPSPGTTAVASTTPEAPSTPVIVDPPTDPPQQNNPPSNPPSSGGGGGY